MARTERDTLSKAQRELALKLKDLEIHRTKLDKEHIEVVERFKSEVQRQYSDTEWELERRRVKVEEDEQRVKMERERIQRIENSNISMNKDLETLKGDLKRLTLENNDLFKENRDMKEQLRILNENLKRETEILLSRDRENNTLLSENKMLKERLDEYKSDSGQLKDE